MLANRFDDLVKKLSIAGTRREFLRVLAGSPLAGPLAAQLEETEAGRSRRQARQHSGRDRDKGGVDDQGKKSKSKDKDKNKKGKRKDAPPCANAGQTPKRGKRCCPGLVKDGTGSCAQPIPPPNPSPRACAETCAGCCLGAVIRPTPPMPLRWTADSTEPKEAA